MLTYFFGNKGSDLKYLLESSVKLFGEGQVLIASKKRLILSAFNHLLLLTGLLFVFYDFHRGPGSIMLAVSIFFMFPFSFFYHVRMRACQTWTIYTTITKNISSWQDAVTATGQVKWSLRFLAMIEFLIATRTENSAKNQGFSLTRILLSALETVFDVAEDFLLPAIVIEQKSITEVVPKLEQLKTNIPAALTGAFGLDLFGKAIASITFIVRALILLVGCVIGWIAAANVPIDYVTTIPESLRHSLTFLPEKIVLIPVIAAVFFNSFMMRALKISVSSIKDTYFAVFYTSINRPLEIRENLRENLTNFLKVKDRSFIGAVKADLAQRFPEIAKGPIPTQPTDSQQLQAIEHFFQENVGKHSLERIHDYLRGKGYTETAISSVMMKYKKSG